MKKQIARTFAAVTFGLLFIVAASSAAQAQGARRAVVEVPFEFLAGQERLPAGRYTVRPASQDGGKLMHIRSEDGRVNAVVLTNAAGASAPKSTGSSLVFRRYGDRYFLAQVFISGAADGRELAPTGAEKNLRRELRRRAQAGAGAEAQTVTIVGGVQ